MGILDAPAYSRTAADAKFAANPLGRSLLYKPENLARWNAALPDAINVLLSVPTIGDSHLQGNDASNGTDTSSDVPYRRSGLVGQLNRIFAKRYGDVGTETVLSSTDTRLTRSGSGASYVSGVGINSQGIRLTSGGTITTTLPKGYTVCRVHGIWESDTADAPPTVTVNGIAQTVVADLTAINPAAGGTKAAFLPYFFDITGSATTDDAIVINGPATKQWDWSFMEFLVQTDTGVVFERMALGGGKMSDFYLLTGTQGASNRLAGTAGSNRFKRVGSSIATTDDAGLVMCDFQTNHASTTGQTGTPAFTPALHAQYHTLLADYVTGVLGKSYLILIPPPWPLDKIGTTPESAFTAAAYGIADTNPNVSVFDISKHPSFVDYNTSNALGLRKADGHMNRAGHTKYAALLTDALTFGASLV